MKYLFLLVAVLVSTAAYAADAVTAEKLPPLPGADTLVMGEGPDQTVAPATAQPVQTPAQAQTATDTKLTSQQQIDMVCQGYTGMQNVQGPNYVPGVDAYGRPVAPADVSSQSAFDMPERIDIPVQINVAQAMNLKPANEMDVTPGTVTVFKDGRVLYNGQDVRTQVGAYCANPPKPQLNVNVH